MSDGRVRNFNAGPGALPYEVLCQVRDEMLNFRGTGMSIGEMSHRSPEFLEVIHQAEKDLRELMKIPSNYKVLFLSGGGTGEFAAVPLNLAGEGGVCDYLITGTWSKGAAVEASKFCRVHEACNFGPSFCRVDPSLIQKSPQSSYLYVCTNETVNGVFYDPCEGGQQQQQEDVVVVADMSSELLTREVQVEKYGVIFAGAQKNVGVAGVTVVIVREDLLGRKKHAACPIVLDYSVASKNDSMYNTPPTMAIYIAGLVFKWSLKQGGVAALEQRSRRNSEAVYSALERYPNVYRVLVEKPYRSRTNIVFRTQSEETDKKFVSEAAKRGMVGLAGHRSVGGIRASLYNAVPQEDVDALIAFIEEFATKQ